MPFVTATRATTAQLVGVGLPKFEAPLPNRFIGDDDPALRVVRSSTSRATQREAEIQPDCVAHDFRRKAETFGVESKSVCFHEAIPAECSATLPS
jgi:hypothetical protein